MNITLELPSELERELSTEASQLKLPLAEYILRVLSFRPFLQNPPKTGMELVASNVMIEIQRSYAPALA